MIKVDLYQNNHGQIYRFRILNHGEAIVCAGVSALAITCVNFIISRFKVSHNLEYDEDGGLIDFKIPEIKHGSHDGAHKEIALIIDNMVFGLAQIRDEYKNQMVIRSHRLQ